LSSDVYKVYPTLPYPFTQNDLNIFYDNNVPVLKSTNINDLTDTITDNIFADNWGASVSKDGKIIALYNYYANVYVPIESYEDHVRSVLGDFISPILKELNVGDYITIYMFGSDTWGLIITRTNTGYEISHYKSFLGNF
jgi:hypothetical protein